MSDRPPDSSAALLAGDFPLLPLRRGAVLPGTFATVPVGRERSLRLLQAVQPGAVVAIAVQLDPKPTDPSRADLHGIGVLARIHRIRKADGEGMLVSVEGLQRFELGEILQSDPYWIARCRPVADRVDDPEQARLFADALRERVRELARPEGGALEAVLTHDAEPGVIADRIAATLGLDTTRDLEVLSALEVGARLRLVANLLGEAKARAELKAKIGEEVRRGIDEGQRERILREQLKAIQRELGDDKTGEDRDELAERLAAKDLPATAREAVDRELRRLGTMAQGHPEQHIIRTYLEWIADMPWNHSAPVSDDLDAVARKLDHDHHGLDEVKKRILEHMAVHKLSGKSRGTILCLAGPPGVGKTSLGQSIAEATGRPFARVALGGVRDEADLRGHRRTYIGALPGRIVSALKQAKADNPVILLDEIDKLGRGWQGSPEAALLEVLDPEQNSTFVDHYLDLEFDLSKVLFICTANQLDEISPPLRDRLEIIEIPGYTPDEKVHIARNHLIPRRLRDHALGDDLLELTDAALAAIVRDYTREAGVRQLDRRITKLCRALALQVARAGDHRPAPLHVDVDDVAEHLGRPKYFSEVAERTAVAGVATGLAWTPVGGDILFVETSRMPGKGQLQITGQLGEVMQESAKAALTYVRSNAERLGIDPAFLDHADVHVHVPAGAVPKDGPSAGVTIFTALASLLTGRRVRPDTAMTGECTLRGRVLPVGGIKAKVLAAHRAGMTRVILPQRNARDLEEVPTDVRDSLEFVLVDDMDEVLRAALQEPGVSGTLGFGATRTASHPAATPDLAPS